MHTVSIKIPVLSLSTLPKFDEWLQQILWEHKLCPLLGDEPTDEETTFDVHRVKGMLNMDSGEWKMVQGVRDVFEITDLHPLKGGDKADPKAGIEGKLVMIGKGLADLPWSKSLTAALASQTAS